MRDAEHEIATPSFGWLAMTKILLSVTARNEVTKQSHSFMPVELRVKGL